QRKRFRIRAKERTHLNVLATTQQVERPIAGIVVKNKIAGNEFLIVSKKEGQKLFLIPAQSIQVNFHLTGSSRRRSCLSLGVHHGKQVALFPALRSGGDRHDRGDGLRDRTCEAR